MEELIATRPPPLDLTPLLAPQSVTLVGASEGSYFSERLIENLSAGSVDLHLVNPKRSNVGGHATVPELEDISGGLDQVIVLVSARRAPKLLDKAQELGARSAIVVGSIDPGTSLDEFSGSGIVVLGAGSLGYIGGGGEVNALATHFSRPPRAGNVALISQSGGLAVAAARLLDELGTGVSLLTTVGSETWLDATDVFHHAVGDSATKAIVLLLEGVRHPRNFIGALREARRAGKPVIIMKLGQSERGGRMALTHTGALAGDNEAFAAVCRRFDAVITADLDEAVDAASVLTRIPSDLPPPSGRGVVVVTASGAAGIAAADAAARRGVELADLAPETVAELENLLPSFASVSNPLDVTAQVRSDPEMFARAVQAVRKDPRAAALLFAFALGLPDERSLSHQASFEEIADLAEGSSKPLLAASIARSPISDWGRRFLTGTGLPFARSYDSALLAFDVWLRTRHPFEEVDLTASSVIISADADSVMLDEVASKQLLRPYGVLTPREEVVSDAEQAVSAAEAIGYPVAVKIVSAELPHKADAGGVALGVADEEALRAAMSQIQDVALRNGLPPPPAALVSEMVAPEAEIMVGAFVDEQFGPMVVCGHGGSGVERLGLRPAVAMAPLSGSAAVDLLRRSGVGDGLEANSMPVGRGSLAEVLIGVSRLVADHADTVRAVDVNPVAVLDGGRRAVALDALIQLRD